MARRRDEPVDIFLPAASSEFIVKSIQTRISMKTGLKILLAIVAAGLLILGTCGYKAAMGWYRWKARGVPKAAGPLDYAQWKNAIEKCHPSLLKVPLDNDPTQSFAFFFDAKENQLILCWYRQFELPNGRGYWVDIDPDSTKEVEEGSKPSLQVQAPLGGFLNYSYSTGLFLQIRQPTVSEFKFALVTQSDSGDTKIHFKAHRQGTNGWRVARM